MWSSLNHIFLWNIGNGHSCQSVELSHTDYSHLLKKHLTFVSREPNTHVCSFFQSHGQNMKVDGHVVQVSRRQRCSRSRRGFPSQSWSGFWTWRGPPHDVGWRLRKTDSLKNDSNRKNFVLRFVLPGSKSPLRSYFNRRVLTPPRPPPPVDLNN